VTFTATISSGPTGTVTFYDGSTSLGTGTISGTTATLTTTSLAGGSHNITANWAGNTNYGAVTSSVLTQTVNKVTPTLSVASSKNPSTYGGSVTFTATISSGPTGTVTFYDGSTSLGTGTLSGTTATFTTTSLAVGSHSITASWGGNTNYSSVTSSPITQSVIVATTPTPTFSPAAGAYPSAQLVSISDTSSNATIYYTVKSGITGTTPTTTSTVYPGGAITVSTTETLEAIAVYAGSQSSAAIATYTIAPIAASTTTLAVTSGGSPVSTVVSPSLVTLTATVASGTTKITTGTVNFCDATATYCTDEHLIGKAQLTSAGAAAINIRPTVGSRSYKAIFVGTSSYSTSSSSTDQLTVTMNGKYPTATGIAAINTANGYTVSADVVGLGNFTVAPTGTVSILDTSNANAVLGTASVSSAGTTLAFTNASTSGTGNDPGPVITGDFNGDGKPDLAVGNYGGTVTILLGNGDGTFTQASGSPITVGTEPISIAVADFNGDGKLDLAVVNFDDGTVTILLGNGDGTFTQANGSPITGFNLPEGIAVGDFNEDGKLDLAVTNTGGGTVTILLGNGDGTFTTSVNSPAAGASPISVVAGDFNQDGKLDLAVTNSGGLGAGTVTILLGNGDGTFAQASGSPITVGEMPVSIAVADFNGDGKPDLAVVNENGGTVTILLGNGDGTFNTASRSPFAAGIDPFSIVVGDFNGDGKPDLVWSRVDNTIAILLGNGDGTFTPAISSPITMSQGTGSIAVADFNGDGTPDLAVANAGNTISILQTDEGESATATVTGIEALGFGTHNVVASYGGDTNFAASTSSPTPLTAGLGVSPVSGPVGTLITITGSGFGIGQGASSVVIGGVTAVPTAWSNTQIQVPIPNGLGIGPQSVVVTVASQTASGTFSVTPGITGITPSSGLPGAFVNITGTNFGSQVSYGSSVTFNSISAQVINWTSTSIQVIAPPESSAAPAGVTTGPVIVTVYDSSNALTYASNGVIFTAPSSPTITGLSPVYGPVGTSVTISGFNFGTSPTAGAVTFNGVPASPTTWVSEAIIVPVPAVATTGPVMVTVGGVQSNNYNYTVIASITSVNPLEGKAGAVVTISGTGFGTSQGSSTVTFNGFPATPSNWSNTSILVPVPPNATTGIIAVTVNGLAATGPEFEVDSASSGRPSISGLSPAQGPVGMLVTISGSNFGSSAGSSNVGFGSVPAVPVKWSPSSIVVPVPAGAVSGPVIVVFNGQASNSVQFTVGPSVASIVGSVTNATGGAAISGASVQVLQSNAPVSSAISAVNGSYSVSGLPAGTYDLLVSAVGFGISVIPGDIVTPSGTTTVNVPLGLPGTIAGTVTQSNGTTPIIGATVTVLEANDTVATATTNATGAYSVSGLGAATYALQASASGYVAGNQTGVSVSSSQTTTANFSLSGQSTIAYTYDELGRLVGVVDPVNGTAVYSYDAVGNVKSITRANAGQVSVLDFTPKSGPVGTAVSISGTAFNANATQDSVTFAGTSANVTSASTSQLAIVVPTGATTSPITVRTPGGTATSSASFTVTAPVAGLSISSFTPAMANVGGAITIAGTGFDVLANDRLTFNGMVASVTSATSTSISTTVPATATSGPIAISTPAGSAASSTDFFVVPAAYTPSQVDFTAQIAVGGSYSGTIVNGGDIGLVLFNGILGQEFNLQINGSTVTSGNISILNPNGSLLAQSAMAAGSSLLSGLVAPATGTYTILVASGSGTTGALTVSLLSPTVSTITSGATQTAVVNTPGQSVLYAFTGIAGQVATVQLTNNEITACNVNISILNPNGSTLASTGVCGISGFLNPIALPTKGTYTLVVSPQNGGTGSANVTLTLFVEQTGTIIVGTPTSIAINTPGQDLQLKFFGTQGQLASAQVTNGQWSAYVNVSILGPDGSPLTQAVYTSGGALSIGPVSLPSTGTYSLLIAPYPGFLPTGSATATVTLTNNVVGPAITPGTPATATITVAGQSESLPFSGQSGQLASVAISAGAWTGYVNVSILGPDGSTLTPAVYTSGGTLNIGPVALPSTGTYSLLIAPYPEYLPTGSATVTVTLMTPSVILPGNATSVAITATGQIAQQTFNAVAGQSAGVQVSNFNLNVACGSVTISIINPNGATLASGNACGTVFQTPVALPATGIYILQLAPQSNGTGNATLTLSISPSTEPTGSITPGTPTMVTITTGQSELLTFAGTLGQLASAQVANISLGCCEEVTVLNPDGTTLMSSYLNGGLLNLGPVALQATGTYTLVFSSYQGNLTSGSATLTVGLSNNIVGAVIMPGIPTPVTIGTLGQSESLTFTGTAGQSASVQVNAYWSCCEAVTILNPDGTILTSNNTGGGSLNLGPVALPATGTYSLVFSPYQGNLTTGSGSATLALQ
jgi:YD repeat-containing protein